MRPNQSNQSIGTESRADVPGAVADAAAIMRVLAEVIRRRNKGEVLPDAQVIASHPQLMPKLAEELEGVRMVQRAFAAGSKAAPINTPLVPIPLAQLETPIGLAVTDQEEVDEDLEGAQHTINGYRIYREISQGGQATVFKGLQETTGKTVAIKVLPGGPLAGSLNRRRFDQEAEILARLDHPNIVGLIDRGVTSDNSLYLVMPHIDGKPLDEFGDLCRRDGERGMRRLLGVLIKLARAVGDAHVQGIVHRDLKPSNILVDRRDEPHLLDFGLARLLCDDAQSWRRRTITVAGQVVGSLPWSSPEQAQGESADADPRSDVYSLGLCIQQALTGEHAYSVEGSIAELLERVRSQAAAKLRPLIGLNTPRLQQVLNSCLAKAPDERYATAGILAAELDAALYGRPPLLSKAQPDRLRWVVLCIFLSAIAVGAAVVAQRRITSAKVTVFNLPSRQNSAGMTLVRIPSDSFTMGNRDRQTNGKESEAPRQVRIEKPYWLATREVNRRQFAQVMNRSEPSREEAELPITDISAIEAEEFCQLLSRREGRTYRLPTEAEWEYACRAGTAGDWSGTGKADEMGWNVVNSERTLHPCAKKQPNHWGLYDMHGNASEWCRDRAVVASIPSHPVVDLAVNGDRVIRGGSFLRPPSQTRSFVRDQAKPDSKRRDLGFRILCED